MRLINIVRAVFAFSIIILVLLPFAHDLLQHISHQKEDKVIEDATRTAVNALKKLKSTTTAYDLFLEERQRRLQERETIRNLADAQRPVRLEEPDIAFHDHSSFNLNDGFDWTVKGPFQTYTDAHSNALPVLVVCYNRANELATTLDSLLKQPSIDRSLILVSQDGNDQEVHSTALQRGLKIIQNIRKAPPIKDGGKRIASHYRFSLVKAFETFQDAPAIIILEDDLSLSPDFLSWFVAAGRVVEKDPSLWCVSAWNDNGFTALVKQPYAVKRTILFPGLGWLLFRNEFEKYLKPTWPDDQWDWYVRRVFQRKGRECLIPEISRTFHIGRKGTYVCDLKSLKYLC